MTVSFIDPPGRLGNSSEPIDFTTSKLVTSISVEFHPTIGNGRRDTVWDGTSDVDDSGGDFAYAYRNSTHSDLTGEGPYTWHIVPAGRWPEDFRIRIKESSNGGTVPPVDRFAALTPTSYEPVAQWALQGGTANYSRVYQDRSGNNYNLTKGQPAEDYDLIPGQKCIQMVSSPGQANVKRLQRTTFTPALQITGDLTVTCRVKRTPDVAGPIICQSGIFGAGNTRNTLFACSILADGTLEVFWEATSGNNFLRDSTSLKVPLNTWCWVSFRRNISDGRWTFGVNTAYENTVTGPGTSGGSESYTSIGCQDEDGDGYWAGDLADVSVWDKRLTDDELLPLYKTAMGV